MKSDITELLRSMPDLEPPADAWQRISEQQARIGRRRWRGVAMAASVVIAVVVGAVYTRQPELILVPVEQATVQPLIVSAPATQRVVREVDPDIRDLQQRSQYMERLLSGLPRSERVARADTAGVIAELEDRIVAVDYLINRARFDRTDDDWSEPEGSALRLMPANGNADASDLWRRRVEYMDQLVRAHYVETGIMGF